jgi:hypothetical protein
MAYPSDLSSRLSGMGFVSGVDFRVEDNGSGTLVLLWLSGQPMPSEATINAFDMSPAAVLLRLNEAQRAIGVAAIDANRVFSLNVDRAITITANDQINLLLNAIPRAIQSLTRSGTTATATTPSAHGLNGTTSVGITGADVAAYNGIKSITVTGATTFTFTVAGSPATPAAGSIFYALTGSAPPLPRTDAQALTSVKNKITSGAVD